MRRKRILIIAAACVLVGIGVVAFWPGEKEPEYNGKKLSEWLTDFEEVPPQPTDATLAVHHIGTNGLPWLVKWIEHGRPAWKDRLAKFVFKTHSSTIIRWYRNSDRKGFDAVLGFEVLGPKAAPAVPELARIAKYSNNRYSQEWAMDALRWMGKDGFPPLLAALDEPRTKTLAAYRIGQMPDNHVDISAAFPGLLLIDRHTRQGIEQAEKAGTMPKYYDPLYVMPYEGSPFLIPGLMNCLHHTNSDVRAEAARALGSLYDKARPAVPALKEALDDRVIAVQEAAIEALEKIAPEVLTNGESHL